MWLIRTVLTLLLLLLVVGFAYNNTSSQQNVDVHLQPLAADRAEVPLVTVVFFSFLGGAILSMLLFVSMYLKVSLAARLARKRNRALESEVAILRNRPIEESAELLKGADRIITKARSPFAEN